MKTLTLVPPAQAEALFDSLEERPYDRFASLPWQDDDAPEEPSSTYHRVADQAEDTQRRRSQSQRRAA